MPFQIQGNSGTVAEVETNTRAMRVVRRPPDVGSLGAYAISQTSGTIAAGMAANGLIYMFRWTSANLAIIRRVTIAAWDVTTGFAAGNASFGMIVARSFSAADTGGTSATLTGNNQKKKTSFGTTLGVTMIANTAALAAGTKTLDGNDLSRLQVGVPTTANFCILPSQDIWSADFAGEWPLVLAQNEGFNIRATVPATGTWAFNCCVEWTEVASF